MDIGISTACFYPMDTEIALKFLGDSGVKTVEIFLNSLSEVSVPFIKNLKDVADCYGMNVVSLHPLSSFAESYMLFSNYKRRFFDTKELYKRYYDAGNLLGAKYLIIHGDMKTNQISDEEYFERFASMIQDGKGSGIKVVQENVNRYRSDSPEFLKKMKAYIGDDLKFVLDVKQAVRSGHSVFEFVNAVGRDVVHIHISDNKKGFDCLLPGDGDFDFEYFVKEMDNLSYCGDFIVEVYCDCFAEKKQVIEKYELFKNRIMSVNI